MRIHVYWNLHKKVWSVRDPKTRKVIRHVPRICLRDARFVVSQSGLSRCLREQRRTVHAWAEGVECEIVIGLTRRVYYNPYRAGCFQIIRDGMMEAISQAAAVFFASDGRAYA